VSDLKWQYVILVIVFIGALALSLWTAARVSLTDIERSLTNVSENEHEGLIEGGNVPLYIGIVAVLFFVAAVLAYQLKHRA
jgi:hypothetical protein